MGLYMKFLWLFVYWKTVESTKQGYDSYVYLNKDSNFQLLIPGTSLLGCASKALTKNFGLFKYDGMYEALKFLIYN